MAEHGKVLDEFFLSTAGRVNCLFEAGCNKWNHWYLLILLRNCLCCSLSFLLLPSDFQENFRQKLERVGQQRSIQGEIHDWQTNLIDLRNRIILQFLKWKTVWGKISPGYTWCGGGTWGGCSIALYLELRSNQKDPLLLTEPPRLLNL